jgi:putative membrane protein
VTPPAAWAGRHPDRPDEEPDPDYRYSLANERTFLAWIRTALSLVAGAVAVLQLLPASPDRDVRWLIGAVLAATAAATAVLAYTRWAATERAMRSGMPRPQPRGLLVVAATVGVLSLGVLALALGGAR